MYDYFSVYQFSVGTWQPTLVHVFIISLYEWSKISVFISTVRSGRKNDLHVMHFCMFSNKNGIVFVRMCTKIGSSSPKLYISTCPTDHMPNATLCMDIAWHLLCSFSVERAETFIVRAVTCAGLQGLGSWCYRACGHKAVAVRVEALPVALYLQLPDQPCLVDRAESCEPNHFLSFVLFNEYSKWIITEASHGMSDGLTYR